MVWIAFVEGFGNIKAKNRNAHSQFRPPDEKGYMGKYSHTGNFIFRDGLAAKRFKNWFRDERGKYVAVVSLHRLKSIVEKCRRERIHHKPQNDFRVFLNDEIFTIGVVFQKGERHMIDSEKVKTRLPGSGFSIVLKKENMRENNMQHLDPKNRYPWGVASRHFGKEATAWSMKTLEGTLWRDARLG